MAKAILPFPEGHALPHDASLIQLNSGEKLIEMWATPFFPIQQHAPLAVTVYHQRALDCFARSVERPPFDLLRYLVYFVRLPGGSFASRHILDCRLLRSAHRHSPPLRQLETRWSLYEHEALEFIQEVVQDNNHMLARKFIPGVRLHKVMWQDPAPIHPQVRETLHWLQRFQANRLWGARVAYEIG